MVVAQLMLASAMLPHFNQEALIFEAGPKVHEKSVASVDFGADYDRAGKRDASFLVTASQDGTAIIWNLPSRTLRHKLVHYSGDLTAKMLVNQVRVRPGGTAVALAGADGRITIWNTRTGAVLKELAGHTGRVNDLKWSGDGRLLASCDDDGGIVVWDVAGAKPATLPGDCSWPGTDPDLSSALQRMAPGVQLLLRVIPCCVATLFEG